MVVVVVIIIIISICNICRISPEGVDVVLDSLCGEDTNRGISLLKPLGRYILYGKRLLNYS